MWKWLNRLFYHYWRNSKEWGRLLCMGMEMSHIIGWKKQVSEQYERYGIICFENAHMKYIILCEDICM